MSEPAVNKVSLTSQHLIVEYVSTDGIFGMVAPSLKLGGVAVASTNQTQVMRYVYTLAQVEDVYFEGVKLQHMPGFRELATEWLKPGQQLVSVPNGKTSVVHVYTGKKSIFQGAVLQTYKRNVPIGFIPLVGSDPAANRILYGNPAVPFIQRGSDKPMAAAYYNSTTQRFEILQQFERSTLLQNFQRRFAQAMAATG